MNNLSPKRRNAQARYQRRAAASGTITRAQYYKGTGLPVVSPKGKITGRMKRHSVD